MAQSETVSLQSATGLALPDEQCARIFLIHVNAHYFKIQRILSKGYQFGYCAYLLLSGSRSTQSMSVSLRRFFRRCELLLRALPSSVLAWRLLQATTQRNVFPCRKPTVLSCVPRMRAMNDEGFLSHESAKNFPVANRL